MWFYNSFNIVIHYTEIEETKIQEEIACLIHASKITRNLTSYSNQTQTVYASRSYNKNLNLNITIILLELIDILYFFHVTDVLASFYYLRFSSSKTFFQKNIFCCISFCDFKKFSFNATKNYKCPAGHSLRTPVLDTKNSWIFNKVSRIFAKYTKCFCKSLIFCEVQSFSLVLEHLSYWSLNTGLKLEKIQQNLRIKRISWLI